MARLVRNTYAHILDPVILLLGICPTDKLIYLGNNLFIKLFTAFLKTDKDWK